MMVDLPLSKALIIFHYICGMKYKCIAYLSGSKETVCKDGNPKCKCLESESLTLPYCTFLDMLASHV